MSEESNLDKLIEKTREAAVLGKLKLYQDLTRRIAAGEKLKPTELKLFNQLDKLFSGEQNGDNGEPPDIFDNYDDALEYLGVSRRTLSVNIKKGNIRQNSDGTFQKSELDRYLKKYGRKTEDEKTEPTEILIKKADLRWRIAKAVREEMLVKQLKGTLIQRDEVYTEWAGRVALVTSALEIFADRLPPLLQGKKREKMYQTIKQEVWELRDSFCTKGKYCPKVEKEEKKEGKRKKRKG